MKKLALILISILFVNFVYGQTNKSYSELITEAISFYESKEYLKAGSKFSEAFMKYDKQSKDIDRYNAACSWALANQPDSAFVQLFLITTSFDGITTDSDLELLHSL